MCGCHKTCSNFPSCTTPVGKHISSVDTISRGNHIPSTVSTYILTRDYLLHMVALACLLWLYIGITSHLPCIVSSIEPRGIVIDAGWAGSRLHIYSWEARVYSTYPAPISIPDDKERWTARIFPGVGDFSDNLSGISAHMAPLIAFAKDTLKDHVQEYADIPIYFYATGGMRQLNLEKREQILESVRDFLRDSLQCPFLFQDEFARVISGEEEALYSWAAANYLQGTLLSASTGTYGIIDIDGVSVQIAYCLPSQDVLGNLYKFQLSRQNVWSVYAKSYLQFGMVSARQRYLTTLVDAYLSSPLAVSAKHKIVDSCFCSGYSEKAFGSDSTVSVEVVGPELPEADQLARCMDLLRPLMEMQNNDFCNMVYSGDCAIAGSYQPPLPDNGRFISTGSLVMLWNFLQLPTTASITQLKSKARSICQMNFADIIFHYQVHLSVEVLESVGENLPYFCFMSSYAIVLLQDGFKFTDDQTVTVMDQVNGNMAGWPLGVILYEINELSWEYQDNQAVNKLWRYIAMASVLAFVLGAVSAFVVYSKWVESPYVRVHTSDMEAAGYSDDLNRISTIELLRRRMDNEHDNNNLLTNSSSAKVTYGTTGPQT